MWVTVCAFLPTSAVRAYVWQLVAELNREETREAALLELSKKREAFPDLAPILWQSFGTTATLLQVLVFSVSRPNTPRVVLLLNDLTSLVLLKSELHPVGARRR